MIDELLAGARAAEEISDPDGLWSRLTKRLVERVMDAELSEHLGCRSRPGSTLRRLNSSGVVRTP